MNRAGLWAMNSAQAYRAVAGALCSAGPALLFGLRLWAAVCLALYVAFWLELDNAYWAGTSAAIVCQPSLGASLRKASFRLIGTVVGAVAIVVLTACFPQSRIGFLVGLAVWGAACGFVATILRNFASYGAALAGFTAVVIASDLLGATGGVNGEAFTLAVTRVSEICIGIVCAGIVLAGTDFGRARGRLSAQFSALSAEVIAGLSGTLAGLGGEETRSARRDLIRRVIALDPVIDEAIGETSDLRYRLWGLQAGVGGLFAALSGWRTVANHLELLPIDQREREADVVLRSLPWELRLAPGQREATRLTADPPRLRRACAAAVRALVALPADTPSLRLLADGTAEALIGISRALNAMMLLTASEQGVPQARVVQLRVPDWLPALVNATRVFIVISVVELFWLATAWPSGALAVTWSAIFVITFSPAADQAYASAKSRLVGISLAVALAAIVKFAVLPGSETFVSLGIAIGLVLIPAGALSTLPWQAAMFGAIASWFIPLVAPENQITYDTQQFYNSALAIVAGAGAATLAFRLLPPLSPELRTHRLLALSLRDLRRLTTGPIPWTANEWEGRAYSRLSALPEQAEPLQRAQLMAALSVGTEIIRLRRIAHRFDQDAELDTAFDALARGDSSVATERLARLDQRLAAMPGRGARVRLRARSSILAMSEALAQHAAYFDSGAAR
ncbi:putative membrane protein YccC [Bradyrhizobium sp. AZCC 2289]